MEPFEVIHVNGNVVTNNNHFYLDIVLLLFANYD